MAPLVALRQELGSSQLSKSFSTFKQQVDGKVAAISNRLTVLEMLRQHYPDHHVTCVEAKDFDLVGFANAKNTHATLTLCTQNESGAPADMCESVNSYTAPFRRLNGEQGSFEVEYKFVNYELAWKEHVLPVYFTQWPAASNWDDVEYWFILAPRSLSEVSNQVQHPLTQEIALEVGNWSTELHEEIYVFDNSRWKKSKSLYKSVKGASWDEVIMDPKLKAGLIDDVQGFFNSQELYQKFKVGWKRGIILHGVPGNGKTCSIKALVNYLAGLEKPIPSLYVKTLDNKCNMPQWEVASIFKKARSMAPCLLILEDLDSLVGEKVRSYFLNELDGLESNDGILLLGSTNHLSRLDPAIAKRPSRFDRKYHYRIPDRPQRIAYGEFWRYKLADNDDVDFPNDICPLIADLTEGFSFAYMKELFVMSLLTVARGGKGDESDWEEVSESSTPSEKDKKDEVEEDDSDSEKEEDTDCKNCKREIRRKRREKAKTKKAEQELQKQKEKKAREVPTIEVPASLKENVLLKVMQQQIKALIHEMDNTEEEEAPRGIMSNKDDDDDDGCASC